MTDLPKSLADNPRLDRWLRFAEGRVHVSVGKVEIGQGISTALAQIAAEELDISLDRLAWRAGDTQLAPDEGSTGTHAQNKLRSPQTLSMRPTDGQNLCSRSQGAG